MFSYLPTHVFVIETTMPAGHIERELCAFVTGHVGECKVGEEDVESFNQDVPGENPFGAVIGYAPDKYGCSRPVTVHVTPGWFCIVSGHDFRDDGTNEADALAKQRAYCLERAGLTLHANPQINARLQQEWRARAQGPLEKFPSDHGVAILFSERPSDALMELMKERSRLFCGERSIEILAFRLLCLTLELSEEEL